MSTMELMTDPARWDHVLEVMTREMPVFDSRWTLDSGHGRPRPIHTVQKTARRVGVRRRVIWSRVLLPILALACVATYFGNSGLEKQYEHDQQTVYSHLGR